MKNRIKEFRLQNDMTQKECVKKFNSFLKTKNIKGITTATLSRWENGINNPTEKIWDNLATFFHTTVIVLQGALDFDEVFTILNMAFISILEDDDLNEYDDASKAILKIIREESDHHYKLQSLGDLAACYLAGLGKFSLDKNLKIEELMSLDFWKENFQYIILYGQPVIWLITSKPVNLNLDSSAGLIEVALESTIKEMKKHHRSFRKRFDTFLEKVESITNYDSEQNDSDKEYTKELIKSRHKENVENFEQYVGGITGMLQYAEFRSSNDTTYTRDELLKKIDASLDKVYKNPKSVPNE